MSKAQSSLFQLIKSLDKAEKRYFKIYANMFNKQNHYVDLFDFIDKMEVYDENAVKFFFKEQVGTTAFAVTKNYLSKKIIESLLLYRNQTHNNKRQEVRILLEKGKVLFGKRLTHRALEYIYKAERIAQSLDLFIVLSDIYDVLLRHRLEVMHQYTKNRNELVYLRKKHVQALSQMNRLYEYRYLYSEIGYQYRQLHPDKNYINTLIETPAMQQIDYANSFSTKQLFYKIWSLYHFINRDVTVSMTYMKQAIELWKTNLVYLINTFEGFMSIYYNYLLMALNSDCLEKVFQDIDTYKQLINTYKPNLGKVSPIHGRLFETASWIEMGALNKCKRFKEVILNLTIVHTKAQQYSDYIGDDFWVGYCYNAALAHFGMQEYKSAIDYLDKIHNKKKSLYYIKHQVEIKSMYLLAHYEMGNSRFLKYEIQKARYYVEKEKINNVLFECLLKLIHSLLKVERISETCLEKVEKMKRKIPQQDKDMKYKNLLFVINLWSKAKI